MYDPFLNVRIPEELLEEIEALADLSDHSKSEVVRVCLKKYLPTLRKIVEEQLNRIQ